MTLIANRAMRAFGGLRMRAVPLQIAVVMVPGVLSMCCAVADTSSSKGNRMSAVLTEADKGKTVQLHVGGDIVIRLPENAATGYRWEVDAADKSLVGVSEGAYLAASKAVGSGGQAQWIVHAKAPGTTPVKLKCWRRWEGERSVIERFEVSLRVVP